MSEFDNQRIDTTQGIEIMRTFQVDSLPPEVNEFAHYLAGKLGSTVDTTSFILQSVLALHELDSGIDNYTEEPFEHPLVGLSDTQYNNIVRHLHRVAAQAFSEKFATELIEAQIESGFVPFDDDTSTEQQSINTEVITEPITDIETAYTEIIDAARKRLGEQDWDHFGGLPEYWADTIEDYFLLMLRNGPYKLPINLLIDSPDQQAGWIAELLPHQKKNTSGNSWLGFTNDKGSIDAETATIARDHLFLKGIEITASLCKIDVNECTSRFIDQGDGFIERAVERTISFRENHPDRLQ